jgi:hypothetical protein
MPDDPNSIRHEAAVLARRKNTRVVQFSHDSPCDWRPQTVINPEDGQPFTEPAAWNFLADLLEGDEPLECVELRQPPGKKGYVLIPNLGGRKVYIKFQLGSGRIIGRSFHYSQAM